LLKHILLKLNGLIIEEPSSVDRTILSFVRRRNVRRLYFERNRFSRMYLMKTTNLMKMWRIYLRV